MVDLDPILQRLYVVLVLLTVPPVLVVAQLVRLNVTEGAELRAQGAVQATSSQPLDAMRGTILDRAGRALVVNVAHYEVAADPTVEGFEERAADLYALLARLTGEPASTYRRLVEARSSRQYALLVRDLDEAGKEQLEAHGFGRSAGVLMKARFARRYNYDRTAAHVLGHVGIDTLGLVGIAGVEVQYNDYLRGSRGSRIVQRDKRGHISAVVGGSVIEPQHGENLVLTIDLVRQSILEEELARGVAEAGASWGTAIAMDPHTGAILALANVPTYDPNSPGAYPEYARRNHAIADQIEPGSTFKLVTAVAALEQEVVALGDTIDTGAGWVTMAGHTFRDTHGYGRITFAEAIAKSSNVAFVKVASRLEPRVFYQYVRNLGFGTRTAIDLPGETAGTLHRPEDWSRTTLPSMGIGYSISATPLQVLTAYAALANGGRLVTPYLVAERRSTTGKLLWSADLDRVTPVRQAFRPETAAALRPAFEAVVAKGGTGTEAAVEGLRIAGKTGTARTAAGGAYTLRYRSSFVGLFPADDPQVALIIVMNEPTRSIYGGAVSAPVFHAVAERWVGTFPEIAQRVAPPRPIPPRDSVVVPDVQDMPAVLAEARLRAGGVPVRLAHALDTDPWQPVAVQRPAPATRVPAREAVRLGEGDAAATRQMPDLRGLSTRQAVAWLRRLDVAVRLDGTGVVRQQVPAPGAPLPARTGSPVVLTAR